jgi:hypothetical protein
MCGLGFLPRLSSCLAPIRPLTFIFTFHSPTFTIHFDRLSYTTQFSLTVTYDHWQRNTLRPVRSAYIKPLTGGLVVRWVTTSEYPLLYVFWKCNSFAPRSVPPPHARGDEIWSEILMCLFFFHVVVSAVPHGRRCGLDRFEQSWPSLIFGPKQAFNWLATFSHFDSQQVGSYQSTAALDSFRTGAIGQKKSSHKTKPRIQPGTQAASPHSNGCGGAREEGGGLHCFRH